MNFCHSAGPKYTPRQMFWQAIWLVLVIRVLVGVCLRPFIRGVQGYEYLFVSFLLLDTDTLVVYVRFRLRDIGAIVVYIILLRM